MTSSEPLSVIHNEVVLDNETSGSVRFIMVESLTDVIDSPSSFTGSLLRVNELQRPSNMQKEKSRRVFIHTHHLLLLHWWLMAP